jgi:hypothetical protein
MSINVIDEISPYPHDNLPHGNMEKQCFADKVFCERLRSDASNIKFYTDVWGKASTENMAKLKIRYESLTTSLEKRLEYWKAIEAQLDADDMGGLTCDDLAKELTATLADEEFLHEKLLKHAELNRERIETQKRILSKIKHEK